MTLLKIIPKLGLLICSLCIGLFISLLGLGSYKLSPQVFNQTVTDAQHQALLKPALTGMMNKEYSNSIAFISDFNQAFKGVNNVQI